MEIAPHKITGIVMPALRVAIMDYRDTARICRADGNERLAVQFDNQAEDAAALLTDLEDRE